jgi:hypothetical protein
MKRRAPRCGVQSLASVALALLLAVSIDAADHRDGPRITDLNNTPLAALDLNDLYIFRSPGNASDTVLIFTMSPFAGVLSPDQFNPRGRFEIRIDQDLDNIPDLTLRATFSPPDESRAQTVKFTASNAGQPAETLAGGKTNSNLPIAGGGMFRAGLHDDPFFFDNAGFNLFVTDGGGTFPRPIGKAVNFFGPDVNTLAIIVEIPTNRLLKSPDRPILRAWTQTVTDTGKQLDRAGQPLLNYFLIPPVPRNDTSRDDRRDAFNLGNPASDSRKFRSDVISVLTDFWKNQPNRAGALADRLLLPNVITYDTSLTFEGDGFPNGRGLRDDVADFMLSLISEGRIKSDNVADDNGDRITDGTSRPGGTVRPIAFPYIGAANP